MKLGLINFITEIKFLLDSYLCTQLFSKQIASGTKNTDIFIQWHDHFT